MNRFGEVLGEAGRAFFAQPLMAFSATTRSPRQMVLAGRRGEDRAMSISPPRLLSTLVAVVMAVALLSLAAARADATTCTAVDVPVAVGLGSNHVHGTLCRPAPASSTLMVLVPG